MLARYVGTFEITSYFPGYSQKYVAVTQLFKRGNKEDIENYSLLEDKI